MRNLFILFLLHVFFAHIAFPESESLASGTFNYSKNPKVETYPYLISKLKYQGFELGFCKERKTPVWVSYNLGPNPNLYSFSRPSFRIDPNYPELSTKAYYKTGFDRGHMAPNYALMTRFGRQGQLDSFHMTNMVPMNPSLNRGLWANFESKVAREFANQFEQVWVFTGPIFDKNETKLPSGVEIPDSFYKIVLDELESIPRVIAIEVKNEKPYSSDLEHFLVSVDSIENKTGIDFFSDLDDRLENKIESNASNFIWGKKPLNQEMNLTVGNLSEGKKLNFWISSTGKTHNKSCRYYGATKIGKFSITPSLDDCKICGGSK
jgi:endonuclease G